MAGADRGVPGETRAAIGVTDWWRWTLVAAYLALIFFLSAQPKLPEVPGAEYDKLHHFVAYGVMGLLVSWAAVHGDWTRMRVRTVLFATAFCVFYGLTDELHQGTVPERKFDLHDLAADGAGAFLASAASWAWSIIARGRRQAHDV